jgi:large subunit ribosomal protein L25
MKVADVIECKPRQAGNKGVARKLRASGQAPAVMYGPGASESQFLAVDPKMFLAQRQQYGESHLFQVKVDGGKTFKALIKSVDRDPVNSQLLHVDLYAVDMNKPIRLEVRLELEGKPKGLVDGGLLTQIMRTINVQCLPAEIPEKLTLDVSDMDIGDTKHMSDIKLPKGVKLTAAHDEAVAAVISPEAIKEETPVAADAAAAAAGAAAPGAAPAAGAAAPAAGAAAPAAAAAAPAKGEKKEKK